MVIIDNETSQIVAVGGNLGEQKTTGLLNRGTQIKRQTGSSMKPLADIVPGLQEKIITAATEKDKSAAGRRRGCRQHPLLVYVNIEPGSRNCLEGE